MSFPGKGEGTSLSVTPEMAPKPTGKVMPLIFSAIRAEARPGGSSLAFVKKYLKSEEGFENNTLLLKTLKKGVESGMLEKEGASFKIPGEVHLPPPDETVTVKELQEGEGPAAVTGNTVTMSYDGRIQDGTRFDAAEKFRFTLGAGDVIKGWDRGIVGMKRGGKRQLIIPPKLGYGKKGSAPEIPPNATLDFTVTLLSISK